MVSSVTEPSSSAVRVVIAGITMRLGISTDPMRAGVSRMFMRPMLEAFEVRALRLLSLRLRASVACARHAFAGNDTDGASHTQFAVTIGVIPAERPGRRPGARAGNQ